MSSNCDTERLSLGSVNNPDQDRTQSSSSDSSTHYFAISYVWGETTTAKEMLLNGRIFEVKTKNLWLALRNLQVLCRENKLPSLVMWIDAVCIDQMNIDEKSSQVEHMHLVYKHASAVIVWLGVPNLDSDKAFEFINQIEKDIRANQGTSEEELAVTLADAALLASTKHFMSIDYILAWVALHNLLSRPWWTRSWTLQEVVMGKTVAVLCGTQLASWPVVHLASRTAALTYQDVQNLRSIELLKPSNDPTRVLCEWPRYRSILSNGTCIMRQFKKMLDRGQVIHSRLLPQFFRATRSRLGKYEHDKVYSILGLLPPMVQEALGTPNYKLGVERVYIKLVEAYVYGTQSLDIMCFSDHTDTQNPNLPSWTPDWTWIERFIPLQCVITKEPSIYNWHSKSIQHHKPTFLEDSTVVEVSGVLISTIEETDLEIKIIPQLTRKATSIRDDKRIDYVVTEWDLEGFLKDLDKEAGAVSTHPEMDRNEDAAHTLLGALLLRYSKSSNIVHQPPPDTPTSQLLPQPDTKRNLSNMYDSINTITRCRTVARTTLEEFCLVPFWTAQGDLVCQFVGCTVPVVLRRNGQGDFRFIGECYMYQKPAEEMIGILEKAIQSDPRQSRLERFRLV